MSSPHTNLLGGAVQAAVEAVVDEGPGAISVADAGTKEAFLDAWTRTLTAHARHLRAQKKQLGAPVILVHVENCAQVGKALLWHRQPMLGGACTDQFAGMLAVGTAEVGAYVQPQRLKDTAEFTQAIQQAGLGSLLTIALLSTSSLMIWPHGLDAEMGPFQRELDDATIVMDLATLERNLDQFYEKAARQTRTWWLDRNQRITVNHPESTVQNDLWLFLLGKYADRARVKLETTIGNGRADITLDPLNNADTSAVLELKATRDFHTPRPGTTKPTPISLKANIDWAMSGVQQTAAYRDAEGFNEALLCVYDFCAGKRDEIEKAIQQAADQYKVIAKWYWITASHQEHRDDRYPLGSPEAPTSAAAMTPPTDPTAAEPSAAPAPSPSSSD